MDISFIDISVSSPKLSAQQLVEKMKSNGVNFNICSENEAIEYLNFHNNYFRTASYRKNYEKFLNGRNKGKYINLDFAYLVELSKIDMYLRYIIEKMCLDIEHRLKFNMISDIINSDDNGYNVVKSFLTDNEWIIKDIYYKQNSSYVGDLIRKYFTFNARISNTNKLVLDSVEVRCPVWAFMEIITFGQLIKFYTYYYSQTNNSDLISILGSVKSIRNAAAHNNCIIHNLRRGNTKPSSRISAFIAQIDTISKSERLRKLSIRPLYEFISLLYLYNAIIPVHIKENTFIELDALVNERMLKHESYFTNQQIITASYNFLKKVVDFLS